MGVAIAGLLDILVPYILGTGEETLLHLLLEFLEFQGGEVAFKGVLGGSVILALFTLAILKIVATSLTVGNGGSGGLLALGLFAGRWLGRL